MTKQERILKAWKKGDGSKLNRLGCSAASEGDFQTARECFEKADQLGNPSAARNLGILYFEGNGVPQNRNKAEVIMERALKSIPNDPELNYYMAYCLTEKENPDFERAEKLFHLAADHGEDRAMTALGYLAHQRGDTKEMLAFYKKAAAKRNGSALMNLGVVYLNGQGLPANVRMAIKYFLRAEKINPDGDAASHLADCYLRLDEEHAGNQHIDEALRWLKKASSLHDNWALRVLFKLYYYGRCDVAMDREKALTYLQRAIDEGSSDALCLLGDTYLFHLAEGVAPDYQKAFRCYRKAVKLSGYQARIASSMGYAESEREHYKAARKHLQFAADHGDAPAAYRLGVLLREGFGGKPDPVRAVQYFEQAMHGGCSDAAWSLADAYEHNLGGKSGTPEDIFQLYSIAVNQVNPFPHAFFSLGWCYLQGIGCKQNQSKALQLFQRAKDMDFVPGIFWTAMLLFFGSQRDVKQAQSLFERAADLGDARALRQLGEMYRFGPAPIKVNLAKAIECYERLLQLPDACGDDADVLAGLYEEKNPADTQRIIATLRKSYEIDQCGDGMANLADHLVVVGPLSNPEEGIQIAKKLGPACLSALSTLGWVYENGVHGKKEERKAIEFYRNVIFAFDHYDPNQLPNCKNICRSNNEPSFNVILAQARLGALLLRHAKQKNEIEEGIKLLRCAAKQGSAVACLSLARCYETGLGVRKSASHAKNWYKKVLSCDKTQFFNSVLLVRNDTENAIRSAQAYLKMSPRKTP